MIQIIPITSRETYSVRHAVLRKGRPVEDCRFSGDELGTTFHLGAFEKDKIIGVATFLMNKDIDLEQIKHIKLHHCYQLRGMAVLEIAQGKGIGKKLLKHAEKLLKEKHIQSLWFNARVNATSFYENMGYEIVSEPFIIPKVGDHYKMMKLL
ncbi:acetyltransferase (GNAT) family protein [Nonlabens dokdonensis]|jgi:GNAT superfamily N-acetyltransferase|uniref:Acetyltransferase, GNAT family n=2 Tax=Nonlabens dokdonensis TaxID=328515 RepID=L7WDW6_NONDD|nr:GNAT family N-acetyltransferase [Nonlabens dokdonensis]AGC77093.1 acetyltransferase, GNAT family [Nonlabens dokdonensis DSW-6]PZX41052.1 acetyltransferase (GNAT) family protein [Nonlabens dokdonensis]